MPHMLQCVVLAQKADGGASAPLRIHRSEGGRQSGDARLHLEALIPEELYQLFAGPLLLQARFRMVEDVVRQGGQSAAETIDLLE